MVAQLAAASALAAPARAPLVAVPARVDRVPGTCGITSEYMPGRGNAGWTVYGFASPREALAFMDAYPHAAMPCWPHLRASLEPR